MMRKLLKPAEVADKIGQKASWFSRRENRQDLYKRGFPPPVLGDDERWSRPRWDTAAIDAWLDLNMPEQLRAARGLPAASTITIDITKTVQERLQRMGGK